MSGWDELRDSSHVVGILPVAPVRYSLAMILSTPAEVDTPLAPPFKTAYASVLSATRGRSQ